MASPNASYMVFPTPSLAVQTSESDRGEVTMASILLGHRRGAQQEKQIKRQ